MYTQMRKKLTINVDEKIYHGLHSLIEKGKISKYIEDLLKPHIVEQELAIAYQEMAQDQQREEEAKEWIEGLLD